LDRNENLFEVDLALLNVVVANVGPDFAHCVSHDRILEQRAIPPVSIVDLVHKEFDLTLLEAVDVGV
jgi:hypothetical protein